MRIMGLPTVLVLLAEGFEELEFVAPVDLLRRAGAEVTTASLSDTIHVSGRNGITIHADTTLAAVGSSAYACVVLPGGPGVAHLRADPRVRSLLQAQRNSGGWIAAICAAPLVLGDAGILSGRRYTAHFSTAGELPHILDKERVVVDGRIVTSRGAGTAYDLGVALVELLISKQKALEIVSSVAG